MPKAIYICKEHIDEICDAINTAMVDCANSTLSDQHKTLVEITVKHYKNALLNTLFEKGEEENE